MAFFVPSAPVAFWDGRDLNKSLESLSSKDRICVRDSLIEIKKYLCGRCQNTAFEKLLDGLVRTDLPPQDSNCVFCVASSSIRLQRIAEFDFTVFRPPSFADGALESNAALASFRIRTQKTRVLSSGVDLRSWAELGSLNDLKWADTKTNSWGRLRSQLEACGESHVECREGSGVQIAGLRVIECRTRDIIVAPSQCDYVALSYVWGTQDISPLPKATSLPPMLDDTIEDALAVT